MCGTCGCDEPPESTSRPERAQGAGRADHQDATLTLQERVLQHNDRVAADNRAWLEAQRAVAINLMSSPGAGKTTLLERAAAQYDGPLPLHVVEGDQATGRDAERIRRAGGRALQINTGATCHLNAEMLREPIRQLSSPALLVIENVGNLICPSLFDLGEHYKVVLSSVTEGDDKPLKYPHMHRVADLVLLNKIDLLPHVDFSLERFRDALSQVNASAPLLALSAKTGEGLDGVFGWLAGVCEPASHP